MSSEQGSAHEQSVAYHLSKRDQHMAASLYASLKPLMDTDKISDESFYEVVKKSIKQVDEIWTSAREENVSKSLEGITLPLPGEKPSENPST